MPVSVLIYKMYPFTKYLPINIQSSNRAATTIIKSFFGKVLSSTPLFRVSSNRVIVLIFYYKTDQGSAGAGQFSNNALDTLGGVLSELYPNITLELRFTQLQQPYLNSSILAQYLAINASKYSFDRLQNLLLFAVSAVKPNSTEQERNSLPYLTGVKVQLSGLLTTQRAAPRKTVYTASVGTFSGFASTSKNNNMTIEYSNCTSKSRDGAFNIKV